MIRTEPEYQAARARLDEDRLLGVRQHTALTESGLSPGEVERALQPFLSFQAQLAEEITWYERVKRRDFGVISRLTAIGRLLIALRIAANLSQGEFAQRLGVDEARVVRDERNEYFGITVERAQEILDLLGATVVTRVVEPAGEPERKHSLTPA